MLKLCNTNIKYGNIIQRDEDINTIDETLEYINEKKKIWFLERVSPVLFLFICLHYNVYVV